MTTSYPSSPYSGISSANTSIAGASEIPRGQTQYDIDPTPPIDVPTAVHNLLTSTKRLQEVLKLWSVDRATESDVSDLYVKIGHEFNVTISAFAYYHIDLSDIHSIPAELRTVLEHCLSENPSPDVLTSFMPDLRKVLYKLLKGLQSRQDKWRALSGSRPHFLP